MNATTMTPVTTSVTSWQIDPAHSSVEFSVRHLLISTVRGRFSSFSGSLEGHGDGGGVPELEVAIDAASITTGIAQRDEHLRSPDFFDVQRFPTISFRANRIGGDTDGAFELVGDLTIRDTTRQVILRAENHGSTTDPWGNQRAGYSATGKLNRSDFGLTYNQLLEAGGVAIGDEIKITIDVALVLKERDQ